MALHENESGVCACKPGEHAGGWQESRSEACLEREREAWRQMLTRYAERRGATDGAA